jgi:transformation/transcription domain-associated protein
MAHILWMRSQVYEAFPTTLAEAFKPAVPGAPPKPAVRKSKESFKVVTECPLIVMFLFQLYDNHAPANVKTLLPLMVKAINLRAPPDAKNSPQQLALFIDFIAAQVLNARV